MIEDLNFKSKTAHDIGKFHISYNKTKNIIATAGEDFLGRIFTLPDLSVVGSVEFNSEIKSIVSAKNYFFSVDDKVMQRIQFTNGYESDTAHVVFAVDQKPSLSYNTATDLVLALFRSELRTINPDDLTHNTIELDLVYSRILTFDDKILLSSESTLDLFAIQNANLIEKIASVQLSNIIDVSISNDTICCLTTTSITVFNSHLDQIDEFSCSGNFSKAVWITSDYFALADGTTLTVQTLKVKNIIFQKVFSCRVSEILLSGNLLIVSTDDGRLNSLDVKLFSKKKEINIDEEIRKLDMLIEPVDLSDIEDEDGNLRDKAEIEEIKQIKREKEQMEEMNDDEEATPVCLPQLSIMSGATDFVGNNSRYLCYNLIGEAVLSDVGKYFTVNIKFSDITQKVEESIPSSLHYSLGVINNCAGLFASKIGPADNGEEDVSSVYFKSFKRTSDIKEWKKTLPKGENIESLCLGTTWTAALTNKNKVRLFTFDGVETTILATPGLVVASAGFENLLAIAYHSGPTMLENQNLSYCIYDINKTSLVLEGKLPISSGSILKWFSFSEEGILISFDSENILRGLYVSKGNLWFELLDASTIINLEEKHLWPIGVRENELLAIELRSTEVFPEVKPYSSKHWIKLQMPFCEFADNLSDVKLANLYLQNETWRNENYSHLKESRDFRDLKTYYVRNMLGTEEMLEKQSENDRIILETINKLVAMSHTESVGTLFDMIQTDDSKEICLQLLEGLRQAELVRELNNKFAHQKNARENLRTVYTEVREVVKVKETEGVDFKSILEKAKKEAEGLVLKKEDCKEERYNAEVERAKTQLSKEFGSVKK